jgi:SAM-dependent methyltransferase
MHFDNTYEDNNRADSYAQLEFPGTYYLAYRDLPEIISKHVFGKKALDFGCGAGRSTRFLQNLGFSTVGVDISEAMLIQARLRDPHSDYRQNSDNLLDALRGELFDLILSVFTFDNIPAMSQKIDYFAAMKQSLCPDGKVISLVSSPEIYTHEWASFTTKVFPYNFTAKNGDIVKTIMLDVPDRRPIEDVLCDDSAYREIYNRAELEIIETLKPLGREHEPHAWVSETEVAPWVIYVLK